jgi:hypothetical protein
MNDRIRELAEQCGFRSNPDIYDRNQSFDIEKFAELIVKECVAVLIQHHPYTTDPEAYHYAISLIEEHFGVEE